MFAGLLVHSHSFPSYRMPHKAPSPSGHNANIFKLEFLASSRSVQSMAAAYTYVRWMWSILDPFISNKFQFIPRLLYISDRNAVRFGKIVSPKIKYEQAIHVYIEQLWLSMSDVVNRLWLILAQSHSACAQSDTNTDCRLISSNCLISLSLVYCWVFLIIVYSLFPLYLDHLVWPVHRLCNTAQMNHREKKTKDVVLSLWQNLYFASFLTLFWGCLSFATIQF